MTQSEFPHRVYWLLFVLLWLLLAITAVALIRRWPELTPWQVYLYGGLLAIYLVAERRAHQSQPPDGQRAHEPLRYWLSLGWWVLLLGSLLLYALWPRTNTAVAAAGAVLAAAGIGLRVWSVAVLGPYFSGHIETWAGQDVIEAGPYQWIRHPGYLGNMLQVVGMPLILNVYGALVLTAVLIVLFLRRLLWEDAFLQQTLPGYRAYAARTRRLLPGLW
ncbi:MAG: isoprenylcysteine carboxylmethyltransferase family protein [Ardenticatenaceae bacterium]|nr:isoprenylcysteine carboxylmethyltransferase family protein [Ardenticatenaceae bacterium]MCB8988439.1 isoprenylcysteine carboxylmethyltransferase family protein [Ardenticatenaceae bacterium]